MSPNVEQRRLLAEFLRTRRSQLSPEEVGLPRGPGRRRVVGLRREEVAQLSGVGLSWYTWLEQGRAIPVSVQVVELLARALRLTPVEHRHLRRLAGLPDDLNGGPPNRTGHVARDLLEALLPNPAYVLDNHFDILAWNLAEEALWPGLPTIPAPRRNLVRLVFLDPYVRRLLVDWERHAQLLLGTFRAVAGEHAGDPRFVELVRELEATSTAFRAWWPRYSVLPFQDRLNRLDHPTAGQLNLRLVHLAMLEEPGLRATVLLADDPVTARRMRDLVGSFSGHEVEANGAAPSKGEAQIS